MTNRFFGITWLLIIALVFAPLTTVTVEAAPKTDQNIIIPVVGLGLLLLGLKFLADSGAKIQEKEAAEKREAYIAAHPDLDEEYVQAIQEGKIKIGMPASAVELLMGKPKTINRSVSS